MTTGRSIVFACIAFSAILGLGIAQAAVQVWLWDHASLLGSMFVVPPLSVPALVVIAAAYLVLKPRKEQAQ